MKTCYKCGDSKPLESFSVDKSRSDGRHSRCKECRRKHYEANRESVAVASKAHYLANKEHHDKLSLAHYYANFEKRSAKMAEWYEQNKDKVSDIGKAWRQANTDKKAASRARCRAAELLATPLWATRSKVDQFYADAAKITRETGVLHHVDHIVPLTGKTVCGLHCEFNLQVLTGAENVKKFNRYWPDMP